VADSGVRTSAIPTGPRWLAPAALAVVALVAFALHFRPWEVAFLEEWPLADQWQHDGFLSVVSTSGWTLSRPLHLVLTFVGLAIGGGSPAGIFAMMGLVAAALVVFTVWALRPVTRSFWVSLAIGAFAAMHPLFAGGYLQRFLPAQTATLGFVIAAGLLLRWLLDGRRRHLVGTFLALVLGLAVYPGTAVAAPLLALVIGLAADTTWRRRIAGVVAAIASSALVTLYSLVITRLIAPDTQTYETSNLGGAVQGPRQFIELVGGTLIENGLSLVAGVIGIALLGAVLALTGAIRPTAGWIIAGTAIVSPLCTLVFFGNVAWLVDIDRIQYATSLGLLAALLVWGSTMTGALPRLTTVVAVLLVIVSIGGGVRGVRHWQPYIALQHQLFQELKPAMQKAKGDDIVTIVDHTGTFGGIYTLPQYYIAAAAHVMNDDDSPVWLCYEKGDPANSGANLCEQKDTGTDLQLVTAYEVNGGEVDIYVGKPESDD